MLALVTYWVKNAYQGPLLDRLSDKDVFRIVVQICAVSVEKPDIHNRKVHYTEPVGNRNLLGQIYLADYRAFPKIGVTSDVTECVAIPFQNILSIKVMILSGPITYHGLGRSESG